MAGHHLAEQVCMGPEFPSKLCVSYACCELALFSSGRSSSAMPSKLRWGGNALELAIGHIIAQSQQVYITIEMHVSQRSTTHYLTQT